MDLKDVCIGEVLRRLRRDLHLSQEELAVRCNLNPGYISLLERDIRRPGLITLFAIASALEMEASEFVEEIQNNQTRN